MILKMVPNLTRLTFHTESFLINQWGAVSRSPASMLLRFHDLARRGVERRRRHIDELIQIDRVPADVLGVFLHLCRKARHRREFRFGQRALDIELRLRYRPCSPLFLAKTV